MVNPSDVEPSTPFILSDTDRNNLSLNDSQFHPHTWEELKRIIAQNNLNELKRWPSDLRRYLKWSSETKSRYGSVPNLIMKERLKWMPVSVSLTKGPVFEYKSLVPFEDPDDYKIMPNDWPYGLHAGITHLIVWLKNRLEAEPSRGDVTPVARTQIEAFVRRMFVARVKDLPGHEEKVLWFRNWTALQSVPGMEHIHVLVRDVPQEIILDWTGGETIVQA